MRLRDRLILALHALSGAIQSPTDYWHLRTDPACVQHRAPRHGSRLDRVSRGHACTPCMVRRAFVGIPWASTQSNTDDSWSSS